MRLLCKQRFWVNAMTQPKDSQTTLSEKIKSRELLTQPDVREALLMSLYFDTKPSEKVMLNALVYLGVKLDD